MKVCYVLEQDLWIYVFTISFACNMKVFSSTTTCISSDTHNIVRVYACTCI